MNDIADFQLPKPGDTIVTGKAPRMPKKIDMGRPIIYSKQALEDDIASIDRHLAVIRADRGERYGGKDDTLRNVRECDPEGSWRGAYISAVECMNRLKNMFFLPTSEQNLPDFENATDDLIDYAYYIKILGRQKRLGTPTPCENGDCQ